MKIKLIEEYKSISSLPDINLPDFTVLTGINGAGKTHLLEGISSSCIQLEIENRAVSSIVHFNYQDFIVKQINTSQKRQQHQQANLQPQQKIKRFHNKDVIIAELRIVQSKIHSLMSNSNAEMYAQGELTIYAFVYQKMFSMNIAFLDDLPTIDEVIDSVTEQTLHRENISFQREEIELAYGQAASTLESIKQILEDDDLIKRYYRISKNIGIHLTQLGPNNFAYQENVLGEILMHEIKDYRWQQAENDNNKARNKRRENVTYHEEEEFRKINGIPPWELLNQVLNEYSCNGYSIPVERISYPIIGKNFEDFQPAISLVNQSTKQDIGVEDLSSGEKTLLALALMIYKQKKGGTFSEVLLLDEIDGNLHPSMIQQLLNVLENILVKKYGMKVILVTHSPTTIALVPDDSVFTMYRETDSNERLQKQNKSDALKILTEGYATLDEGIKLFDQISRKEISILTEGYNTQYLEKANRFFGDPDKIEVITAVERKSGKNQLKTLYDFFARANHDKKVIFVWDCDVVKSKDLKEVNNTVPYIFEKNNSNKTIRTGIENLFPQDLIKEQFYKKETTNKQGGKNTQLDKNKMREFLIKNGDESDFINFKPFFDWIKDEHLQ